MSNICKTVSLRTRKIKDGRMLSYYLDYYPGYRDESTMKVIRHESLGIYIPEFGISDCRFSCYARFPIGAYYICPPNNMDGKMQEL